jgi:hypothetical protein
MYRRSIYATLRLARTACSRSAHAERVSSFAPNGADGSALSPPNARSGIVTTPPIFDEGKRSSALC